MRQQSTLSDVFISLEKDSPDRNHQSVDSSQDNDSGSLRHAINDKFKGHPSKVC